MKQIFIPPLFDHHSHYSIYASLSAMPTLADVNDHDRACEVVRGSMAGPVTIITGWNSSRFALAPEDLGDDMPVIVLNLSLHGMVMNSAAGIYLSRDYNDIVLNHKDPLWTEKNLSRILAMMVRLVPPSAEKMNSFGLSLIDAGIGAMEDMLLPGAEWLGPASGFPIPVDYWAGESVFAALSPSERGGIKGVKLFTDGALGTCTAALSAPYLSGERGRLLMENAPFAEKLYDYMKQGTALAVHAIGDMAVDQVVNTVSHIRRA